MTPAACCASAPPAWRLGAVRIWVRIGSGQVLVSLLSGVTSVWDLSQTTGAPTSDAAARPSRDPPAGVRDALCWLARRQGYAVELEHGPPPTAPCSGPPAVSASRRGSAASRPCGHWRTSSATCCCTTTPATRPGPPPPAAQLPRPKPTRSPGSPAPATASPPPAACPARPAGPDRPARQPAAAILAAGHRMTTAATRITRHTSRILHGDPAPVPGRAGRQPRRRPAGHRHDPGHPARRQPRTRTRRHHPPHPRRRPCLLHRAARRQLGTRLPARPRHHRRRHPGLAHRVRPRRVDRPHQPPAPPRPP